MSDRTWFFNKRKYEWSMGIGMVLPEKYMSPDDPNCTPECACHDMPDVSVTVEPTKEALEYRKSLKKP
tara:strand:- start:2791 stop:2994 length:204 start_codon:yes stop_codon:yes gene_type:complete